MNYDRERSRLLRELADLDQREREEEQQEAVYFWGKALAPRQQAQSLADFTVSRRARERGPI